MGLGGEYIIFYYMSFKILVFTYFFSYKYTYIIFLFFFDGFNKINYKGKDHTLTYILP